MGEEKRGEEVKERTGEQRREERGGGKRRREERKGGQKRGREERRGNKREERSFAFFPHASRTKDWMPSLT